MEPSPPGGGGDQGAGALGQGPEHLRSGQGGDEAGDVPLAAALLRALGLEGSVANLEHDVRGDDSWAISGRDLEEAGNESSLRLHVTTANVVNLPLPDHCHRLVASQRP